MTGGRVFFIGAIVAGMILCAMSRADATTNRFNLSTDYPPTLQSHFTYTPETPVLGRFQPYVGLQTDYSYRPLRVTDATTLATRPVMNYILAEYLYAAIGIAPRVQLGVVIPFLLQTSFIDPVPVAQPAAEHKRGVSDIRFDVAVNIMDRSKNPVGLSLLGFVTVPTGPESKFLGSSGVTGGGQVIIDTAHWQRLHLSSAIGVFFHERVVFENLNMGQQLDVTTGAAWDFSPAISGTTEFRLRTPFNNFLKNSANTPMEARLGMDWRVGQSGFIVKPGVGFGITYGSSQPLVRGLVAVTYTGVAQPPRPAKEPVPKI